MASVADTRSLPAQPFGLSTQGQPCPARAKYKFLSARGRKGKRSTQLYERT